MFVCTVAHCQHQIRAEALGLLETLTALEQQCFPDSNSLFFAVMPLLLNNFYRLFQMEKIYLHSVG